MFVICFFFSLLIGAPHLDVPAANERNTGGIYKCNALSPRLNDCELLLQSEYSKSTKYMNQYNTRIRASPLLFNSYRICHSHVVVFVS